MKNAIFRFGRRMFRLTNQVLKPWGILISKPEIIHGSPAYSGATMWARRLNHMNFFYQKIRAIEGGIIESGVHWGYGILLHRTANNLMGGFQRHIYGFDSFAGHSKPTVADFAGGSYQPLDSAFAITQDDVWKTLSLGTDAPKDELARDITFVPGWMQETMPAFLRQHKEQGTKIALVHADSDIYEPILATLQNTWPLLQIGGIVILGYINNPELMGKTKAVHEFLATLPKENYEIRTLRITDTNRKTVDNSYIVKIA
jgi:hypothetical protein